MTEDHAMLFLDAKPLPVSSPPAARAGLDHERFARNMAAFQSKLPHIHKKLAAIGAPQAELIAVKGGGYDVKFMGTPLYGGSARACSRQRVEAFFRQPEGRIRLTIAPPKTANLDLQANQAVYRMMQRAVRDHGVVFSARAPIHHNYHLVVLGVGLAEHLPLLAKRTNCQNLILCEPNTEFLYHSLYTFDWDRFLNTFPRHGRKIAFVDAPNPKTAADSIQSCMRGMAPAFPDGTYIYLAYNSSFLEAVARELAFQREKLLTGLGFLEDEIDMVRNTYRNLVDYSGKYFLNRGRLLDVPAFVVAAGPSLDGDLEVVRANVGRAIIVSCGTTLRILLRNGIRPDFHMEMENVPAVYDLLARLAESFSLDGITLVASTTIDPRVKTLFKETIFYFRYSLASYPMFALGRETGIPMALPTVANLGLSFAQTAGIRTIYLFGVDFGTRDQSKHHAKDAAYNVGEIEFTTVINTPMPGNLGGKVFSEHIYLWAKGQAEDAILWHPRAVHYNCSDGVRIEGAIPKLSKTVALPSRDKAAAIADIGAAYPRYTREHFDKSWTGVNHVRNILELRDRLLAHCERAKAPRGSKRFPLAYMVDIARELIPPGDVTTAEMHYFRGTVFLATIGMYYYQGRVIDARKRRVFRRVVREELANLIRTIADRVLEFYRELDPEKTARDEEEAADLLTPKSKPKRTARALGRRPKSKAQAKAKGKTRARAGRRPLSPYRPSKRGEKRKSLPRRSRKNSARKRPRSRPRR